MSITDLNPFGVSVAALAEVARRAGDEHVDAAMLGGEIGDRIGNGLRLANVERIAGGNLPRGLLRGQEIDRVLNLFRAAAGSTDDRAACRKRFRDAEVDAAGTAEDEDFFAAEIERGVHVCTP